MNAFSSWKLSKKLAATLGLIILIFVGSGVFSNLNLNKLGSLQDEGAHRFEDSQKIGNVLTRMESFYAIVGDAVINRNLDETKKDLAASAEQAAATSQELSMQSEVLRKTVLSLTEIVEGKQEL